MKRLLIICLLLSACASQEHRKGDCQHACDAIIKAEDARYAVCQDHVQECEKALEKSNPPLFGRAVWGIIGLVGGIVLGARIAR